MGVHLPIQAAERVEGDRPATAVEHRDARVPRTLSAAPHRRQVRRVLSEHQLGVPLAPILAGVVAAWQPPQVAVERRHLVVLAHRLQASIEHHVRQVQAAPVQFRFVASAQVECQRPPVELVCAADEGAGFLHVLQRLLRRQRLAHGLLRQVVEIRFQDILRRGDHRETQQGVFRHLVEQRVDGIPFAGLAGQVSGAGRHAQPVGDQHAVRHAVEIPGAVLHVGAWLAEEQPLAEIPPARQLDFAGLAFFGAVGVARQRVEALPVLCTRSKHRRARIEPPQQPVVDVGCDHAPCLDAGVRQAAAQAVADDVQHLLGRLAAAACLPSCTAIDHHAHPPRLAAPAQPRDHRVLEQAARLGDRAQVVAEEAQVELGESGAAGTRLHVVAQGLHVLVEAGLVLGIELEYPGVFVQLIERVLERVLQGIAGMREPAGLPPLGAQRHQLVEGSDRLPILQQHGLRLRQELHPRQQFRERRRDVVQRLLVGYRRRPAALDRCAGFRDAGLAQGLDVALPAVRLLFVAGAGCGQLRPGKFPAHQ